MFDLHKNYWSGKLVLLLESNVGQLISIGPVNKIVVCNIVIILLPINLNIFLVLKRTFSLGWFF